MSAEAGQPGAGIAEGRPTTPLRAAGPAASRRSYNLARWLTGNAADAEDVVQEAYLRAYRFFDGFRGDNIRGWLLTIVRNYFHTWAKQNRSPRLGFVAEMPEPDSAEDERTLGVPAGRPRDAAAARYRPRDGGTADAAPAVGLSQDPAAARGGGAVVPEIASITGQRSAPSGHGCRGRGTRCGPCGMARLARRLPPGIFPARSTFDQRDVRQGGATMAS